MSDSNLNPPALPPEEVQRATELLPWYANGSIKADDRAWLAAWLETHHDSVPELITELNWLRQTADQVKANVQLPEPTRGLDTLLARIHAEETASFATSAAPTPPTPPTLTPPTRVPNATSVKAKPQQPSMWQTLQDNLRQLFSQPMLATAFALAFIVQLAIIGALLISRSDDLKNGHDQSLTPLSGNVTAPAGTVLLQVTFLPDTTEHAIRDTLNQANATIISGPGALGIYTLSVPKDQAAVARKTLQDAQAQHHVIDSIQDAS